MFRKQNEKGFTLIELMIVIAIIGILAAIAIPNFIAYRNKTFCSRAESDANSIAAAIADYFAIPSYVNTPVCANATSHLGVALSGQNNAQNQVTVEGHDPNQNITIQVTDMSHRCPDEYQTASDNWDSNDVFTKHLRLAP